MELDNFLGCGSYQPKEGSHLCNHRQCAIHLVYETAQINQERKICHARARFRRQCGLPIAERCDTHYPGCLLQQAALTTYETLLIQFWVLHIAVGRSPPPPPRRPRWLRYPTFEFKLPLNFCHGPSTLNLEHQELVDHVAPQDHNEKPELLCSFCRGIKAFKSVVALWSHLVHYHDSTPGSHTGSKVIVEKDRLLREVRRTAEVWRRYWAEHSDGGKSVIQR